jgi:GNAT superfamily N-acetyltransferase
MTLIIRDALPDDAAAACDVMRRSIAELCIADHRDDPAILSGWLANKQPDIVATWIARPDNSMLVAVEDGAIVAAGSITDAGEIQLNYVSPDARFRGVSRALLKALEKRAVERGNLRCHHQHRDRTTLLPFGRLCRGRAAAGEVRHGIKLPDVEATADGWLNGRAAGPSGQPGKE